MSKKSTQAAATATQPALIDNLATLFTSTQRDYYFGNITNNELFECQLDAINDFLDYLRQFPISDKFVALQRLATCYATHSTDTKIQRETLSDLEDILKLLETITTRASDIEIWADFTGILSNEIANNNH